MQGAVMINYGGVRLRDAIDEILNRVNSYRNGFNIDYFSLVQIVNTALMDTISILLPVYGHNYIARFNVVNGQFLGPNFIKPHRVLIQKSAVDPLREARYVNSREYNALVNWETAHSWNVAIEDNPVYTIYGLVFYATTQPMSNIDIISNTTAQGIMEAYIYPDVLQETQSNVVLPISYEYIDLFYSIALLKLLMHADEKGELSYLLQNIQKIKGELYQRKKEKELTEARQLESFVEPRVPFVPLQATPGEVAPKL